MDYDRGLIFYLESGLLETAEQMLIARADYPSYENECYVNSSISKDGFSALQLAVSTNRTNYNLKVVKLLVKYKANVNFTNSVTGFSVLQCAVSKPDPRYQEIQLLLKYHANANATNSKTGMSVLHSAVLNSVGKGIIKMLLEHGAKVNEQNSLDCRCTPLLYAFRRRYALDHGVIKLLLKHGADIHARDFKNGPNTALQYAINHPMLDYNLLELLLKYKPNINVINFRDGMSVLMYAVRSTSNPKIIELLLESGADVHAKNIKDSNRTALLYAVQKPILSYEEIDLLLRFRSDVNAKNYQAGGSVLQYALMHPDVDDKLIELLLKYNPILDSSQRRYIMDCLFYRTDINPKVLELMCTYTKYKMNYTDLVFRDMNFEAVKILVRRETDHFPVFKKCLELWDSKEKSRKVCLEILKWLVLQHFKKDPKSIKSVCSLKSVLEGRYTKLLSGHKFRDGFFAHINKCILDITSMKLDGLAALLFPELKAEELPSIDTRAVANRLLNIWSKETPSIYLDIIESNIKSKDVFSFLSNFQISTRLTFEGEEKMLFLGYLPTLVVVEYLPLTDMLSLVQAFYGFFKNQSTLEKLEKTCLPRVKHARACKKQKLN